MAKQKNELKKEQSGDFEKEKKNEEPQISRKDIVRFAFLRDEKARKVAALFLCFFSMYLMVALISFMFSWEKDQNIAINLSFSDFISIHPEVAENFSGAIGAWFGHLLIYKWFGISSLVIPVILFLFALKTILGIEKIKAGKFARYSFFIGLWLSVFLGMLLGKSYGVFSGGFGYYSFLWAKGIFGSLGVPLILTLYLLVFLVVVYNINIIKWIPLVKNSTDSASRKEEENKEESFLSSDLTETVFTDYAGRKIEDIPLSEIRGPLGNEPEPNNDENLNIEALEEEDEPINEDDIKLIVKEETPDLHVPDEFSEIPIGAVPLSINPINSTDIKPNISNDADEAELKMEIVEHTPEEELAEPVSSNPPKTGDHIGIDTPYDPRWDLSGYKFPSFDLLKDYGVIKPQMDPTELEYNKNLIVETLKNYNIGISQIQATIGPTVTLYEIIPQPGVRISKIKNLEDDIALSLAALGIRIIAPIPGKGTIGIEVPNKKPEIVPMKGVIQSLKFQNFDGELPLALGKTISNEVFVADLAKMPHLLVAGATGQGKSVGINAILVSLLYKKHPSELKLVLVDPKKVELTLYNKIERHFLAKLPGEGDAIITENKKVVNTLNSLCIEMDSRYALLQDAGVRNIKEYNVKFISRKLNPNDGHKFLPYIVVIVDEFADLIMTAGKEVEHPIGRLAQLARAVGIHLILATQRPSVNIITGTIKANFPARIGFRVTSKIDSRTILDSSGADQLIGKGDLLYSNGNDLIRLQCPFVDTPEVEEITNYIGGQKGYSDTFRLPEYVGEDGVSSNLGDFDPNDRDDLFEDAARLIVLHQQGSTSLIQRKLKLGYNRAGRLIDQLEQAGIVGPFEGSKAREVLIPDEYALEQKLKDLQ